jgi:hypothetical protein
MVSEMEVNYHNYSAHRTRFDPRVPEGHIKMVADGVLIHKFGKQPATIWSSFPDRAAILVAEIENVTYHSDSYRAGGWVNIVKHTLEGMHRLRPFDNNDLVALSLCYSVVSNDLTQFRAINTWTPNSFSAGYCLAESWDWNWMSNPQSKTTAQIHSLVYGEHTTKEESNGS